MPMPKGRNKRNRRTAEGESKMWKLYDESQVPDCMPIPRLRNVEHTRSETVPTPKFSDCQRSWAFDIGLRDVNLGQMSDAEFNTLCSTLRKRMFKAKPFLHAAEEGDTKKNQADDEGEGKADASEEEEDGTAPGVDTAKQADLLRGYSKAAWGITLDKLVRNKRHTAKVAVKKLEESNKNGDNGGGVSVNAVAQLLGLTQRTGHDKFSKERKDEIRALAETLPGSSNLGGKVRKAQSMLYAKEDGSEWDAAAMEVDENLDWNERQKIIILGLQQLVQGLHDSGQFRPFAIRMCMGWEADLFARMEAVPEGIVVPSAFQKDHPQLLQQFVNAMNKWLDKPLKEWVLIIGSESAIIRDQKNNDHPHLMLSADVDDMAISAIKQMILEFLQASFEHAFGKREIPWPDVQSKPAEFYNADRLGSVRLTSTHEFSPNDWYALAKALSSGAGPGTANLFRANLDDDTPDGDTPDDTPEAPNDKPETPDDTPEAPNDKPETRNDRPDDEMQVDETHDDDKPDNEMHHDKPMEEEVVVGGGRGGRGRARGGAARGGHKKANAPPKKALPPPRSPRKPRVRTASVKRRDKEDRVRDEEDAKRAKKTNSGGSRAR
ncbi:hypothetical protein C8R45DRAFT_933841 [Mycena sanguinolenta]|nr:hypothetical protein C8R45DRAFT_933841 [Mycena sanguinolenta]